MLTDEDILNWCQRNIVPILNRARAVMPASQLAGLLFGIAVPTAIDGELSDDDIRTLVNAAIEKQRARARAAPPA